VTDNHYKILGVDAGASDKEIEAAFKKLSYQYDPSRLYGGKRLALLDVKAAYEVLKDPDRRSAYDLSLNTQASFNGGAQGKVPDLADKLRAVGHEIISDILRPQSDGWKTFGSQFSFGSEWNKFGTSFRSGESAPASPAPSGPKPTP